MAAVLDNAVAVTWADANGACLAKELARIRLLLHRKVCWLRRGWQQDPLAAHRGLVISDARADQLLQGADDAAERAFHDDNGESLDIARELAHLEHELVSERSNLASGGMSALESLLRMFSLCPFERDVLLMCFAAEEDPAFATLYAYVQDDATAGHVTAHLLTSVLCGSTEQRAAARAMLLPTATLRHFRLIRLSHGEGPQGARSVRIDERVSDFIRGVNRLDESLIHLLRPVGGHGVGRAHAQIVARLVRWAEATAGRPWPVINLTGAPGAGKRAVAVEFCAGVGLQLNAVDLRRLPQQDADRHELLHLLQREAVLLRLALYVDLGDLDLADRTVVGAARDWVERYAGVLFVAGRDRWKVEREVVHVAVPKLTAGEQHELWSASLEGVAHTINGQIEGIVQQFDFGPGAIPQAVRSAVDKARSRSLEDAVTADDLWHACREHAGSQLGSLAERLTPGYAWDDIVLPDDLMQQVREIADQVAARSRVYEQWGFGARLSRGRGIGALFAGPSGTGKTMAAEILANHLQLDLYRIDLAGVVSKYIGETEKNLRDIFDAAEQSGAILFFDEADALFGKRTEVRDSHDRYANIEVNYLLQRMEDYRGLAILCTNRRASLDRAFLRRLRFLVDFPFPDSEQRRRIWQKMFPAAAPLGALDFAALARLEIPGGSIRNIALNAAFLAARSGDRIETAHVLHAARREYAKIDKLLTAAEFGPQYRQLVAT